MSPAARPSPIVRLPNGDTRPRAGRAGGVPARAEASWGEGPCSRWGLTCHLVLARAGVGGWVFKESVQC